MAHLILDMTFPWADWGDVALKHQALERMAAAGYGFVSLTVGADDQSMAETMRFIAKERRFFRDHDDKYQIADTPEDIRAAQTAGKLAVGFHFQGSLPVEKELGFVEVYRRLGITHMLLAYNQRNFVADGCHETANAPLSDFGVALIREMNRVGMIVDCSHTGEASSLHAMEISAEPVIFSHSNAKALRDHPRNLTEQQIRGCAQTGGVIGVNGMALLLKEGRCDTDTLADQVEYYVDMVGVPHVGIGLDYVYDVPGIKRWIRNQGAAFPTQGGYHGELKFAEPEQLPALAETLSRRGYADDAVAGILGGNWMRLLEQVAQR